MPSRTPAILAIAGIVLLLAALSAPRSASADEEATLSRPIHTASGDITLTLVYYQGDEAWAERMVSLTQEAIPVLEETTGVPYPGRDELEIHEHEPREIFGYAGLADCYRVSCGISVAPGWGDSATLFHELGHVWTQPFRDRWLSEGTAEFLSRKVLARLDPATAAVIDVEFEDLDAPPFALETWGAPRAYRSSEQEAFEAQGYYWSPIFLKRLEAKLGPELIRNAFADIMQRQEGTVHSRDYMDALEDAGGGNNDELFLTFIFSENARPLLAKRRSCRERLASLTARAQAEAPELSPDALQPAQDAVVGWEFEKAAATLDQLESGLDAYLAIRGDLASLRAVAEEAGLAYPLPFENALTTWNFSPYQNSIAAGQDAIEAYRSAATTVSAPRSLWLQIGLYGKDPDGQLRSAVEAFTAANFNTSIERSNAAQSTIEGAGDDAPLRLLIVAALLVGFLTVVAVLWSRSRRDYPVLPREEATGDAGSGLATPDP